MLLYIMLCGEEPNSSDRDSCANALLGETCPNNDAVWIALPSLPKELISQPLAESPRARPTADEVIDHAWLRNGASSPKQVRILDRSEEGSRKRLRGSVDIE